MSENTDKTKLMSAADNLCRVNSSMVLVEPPATKRKITGEEMMLVPVAKADFLNINNIAEALMLARNPHKKEDIKLQRKRMLKE